MTLTTKDLEQHPNFMAYEPRTEFTFTLPGPDGKTGQWRFRFSNGFGASVVRTSFSYGGRDGLFELAVLGHDNHLTYATDITSDVISHLELEDVLETLGQIAQLDQEGHLPGFPRNDHE